MKYMLLNYVREGGWEEIPPEEQERWMGVYRSFVDAMKEAGVLIGHNALGASANATTVRIVDGKTQVLDGPYADTKEQFGGYHMIDVADLDEAISWAARCPTALHGVVEVRAINEMGG